MMVRVKICGITNAADAVAAVEAGADALGFMFFPGSKRHIPPAKVAEIIQELPPFVAKVGVFVNAPRDAIRQAVEETGLDTLQFHGDENPADCAGFGLKTIKAFRVRGGETLVLLPGYDVDAWLLDSYSAAALGGTGTAFDWDLAAQACRLGTPVILAGGLTPDNVRRAVTEVLPFGVDVSSGVEHSPGKKDHARMTAFIRAAKERVIPA